MSEKRIITLIQPMQGSPSSYENRVLGLSIGIADSTETLDNNPPYAHDEFIFIIEGAVEVKNSKTGFSESIGAGRSFVIPHGYDYQWHQQGYLRKLYVRFVVPKTAEKLNTENVIYIDENSDISWKETSDGHRKKILYRNSNQGFTAGVWQGKAFTTGMIEFPYHELILINSGSLICTDETGEEHYFNRGDALFIPQGTPCSWEVKSKVSIHYVQIT
jgi:uncharacterized cupin superfamily protein